MHNNYRCQNCGTLLKTLSWHNIALQSSSEYSAGGGGKFVLSGMWSFILLSSWGNKKVIEHFVETGLGVKQKQFSWCVSKIYLEKKSLSSHSQQILFFSVNFLSVELNFKVKRNLEWYFICSQFYSYSMNMKCNKNVIYCTAQCAQEGGRKNYNMEYTHFCLQNWI